jgi:choice-of-anchor B domain-containing protein
MKKVLTYICIILYSSLFSQESLNMDLVGNLSYPQGTNDIWGYADGGNEYALVGLTDGFSVVDVTNPSNPTEIFFIQGSNSIWRDVKTWGKYAYVTTEASDGLLIVDLSDQTGQTYNYTQEFFTTSHNIYIDENGYAYIFGADTGNGGAVILDLTDNPMFPSLAGIFDDYYLHDGMVRGDTLWGSAIYAGVFSVIDVTDKSNPQIMSSYPTSCNFTHNAWISDDNNYLFTTDETAGCYVGAYDVSDIYDIQEIDLIQEWTGDGADGNQENVIPHNTHVFGDYLVTSYYTSGVTIIDASDPFNMIEVAYYDTSPMTGGSFDGCWGAYPYLPSGLVLATDQQEGLFILHTPYGAYEGFGCTNPNASNYDETAEINDGSCLFIGCTDPAAENFNPSANQDDGTCEYFCDAFDITLPECENNISIDYGQSAILNCEGNIITFFDADYNILSVGSSTYITNPLYENTSFMVYNEEIVESTTLNTGEPEHEGQGQNADYSGSVYNGGLLFDCYSNFTLNTVKVYTDYSGERIIELRNNNGALIYDMLVDIPETDDEGYIISLNWSISPGMQYLLTTNTDFNNDNFGDNNPLLKRTTGGLPNFPFTINNILEITEGYYTQGGGDNGSSPDYYYYFYDWSITYDRTCESGYSSVNVTINNTINLDDNTEKKSTYKIFDMLGREINKESVVFIELYNDGTVDKKVILK